MEKPDLKVLSFPLSERQNILPKDKTELAQLIKKEYEASNIIIIIDRIEGVDISTTFKDSSLSKLRIQNLLCESIMAISSEGFKND